MVAVLHSAAAASLVRRFTTLLKLLTAKCTLLRHSLLAVEWWTAAAFGPRGWALRLNRSVHSPAQSQNNRQRPRQSLPLAQGQRPTRERGRCDSTGGEVLPSAHLVHKVDFCETARGFQPRGTGHMRWSLCKPDTATRQPVAAGPGGSLCLRTPASKVHYQKYSGSG